MAKPPKRRIESGRITPKGTRPPETSKTGSKKPEYNLPSPWWVPTLLFGFLIVGAVIIVINYLGYVPGGEASNWYLLLGLGLILAGMVTATRLR